MKKILKYEASWCGPCKALDSVIEAARKSALLNIDELKEFANG